MDPVVFLSYNRRDAELAIEIRSYLVEHGLNVFFDLDQQPGDLWLATIQKTIPEAACLIYLAGAEVGIWQEREQLLAQTNNIKLIPVLLPEYSNNALWLNPINWIDGRDGIDSKILRKLLLALRRHVPGFYDAHHDPAVELARLFADRTRQLAAATIGFFGSPLGDCRWFGPVEHWSAIVAFARDQQELALLQSFLRLELPAEIQFLLPPLGARSPRTSFSCAGKTPAGAPLQLQELWRSRERPAPDPLVGALASTPLLPGLPAGPPEARFRSSVQALRDLMNSDRSWNELLLEYWLEHYGEFCPLHRELLRHGLAASEQGRDLALIRGERWAPDGRALTREAAAALDLLARSPSGHPFALQWAMARADDSLAAALDLLDPPSAELHLEALKRGSHVEQIRLLRSLRRKIDGRELAVAEVVPRLPATLRPAFAASLEAATADDLALLRQDSGQLRQWLKLLPWHLSQHQILLLIELAQTDLHPRAKGFVADALASHPAPWDVWRKAGSFRPGWLSLLTPSSAAAVARAILQHSRGRFHLPEPPERELLDRCLAQQGQLRKARSSS